MFSDLVTAVPEGLMKHLFTSVLGLVLPDCLFQKGLGSYCDLSTMYLSNPSFVRERVCQHYHHALPRLRNFLSQ